MKKKIISVMLALVMVIALMPVLNNPAFAINSSEVSNKINQIAQQYPDGSYFSANGQACSHSQSEGCDNCRMLNIRPELKGTGLGDAWTCVAFSRYVFYELFGLNSNSTSTNSSIVSLDNAQIGDLVKFSGHEAIFVRKSGDKYYLYESNYGKPNLVAYNSKPYTADHFAGATIYHANNYDSSSSTPPTTSGAITVSVPSNISTGADVVITWTADSNAVKYGLTVWKYPYGSDQYVVFDNSVTGTSKDIGSLPAGSYRVKMKPYYNVGGGPVSAAVDFTVSAPTVIAPTSSNISIAKSTFTIGENVTFSFSGNNSPSFTIGIDKDSTRVDTTVCGTSYTRSFAEAGNYSAYVTAWNSAGHKDSARVYFTIGNKDTILPSGSWIYPTSGIVFQPSGVMTLSVNASDNSGMGKVTFHALYDGAWHELGTVTQGINGTYSFNWNYAVGPQDVLIHAHLYDAAGNYKNIEGPTIKFASFGLNNFEQQNEYRDGQFTDVPSGKWYSGNVGKAYGLGLMVGNSSTTFNLLGNVTVAEAITMACRLNSIFYTGSENFVQDGGLWYSVYLTYAANNEITSKTYNSYTRAITRAEFAEIFANALPVEALAAINTVSDGAIPDVPASATDASSVYLLYRAGIIVGSDAAGTFKPTSNISRAEAAAIVTRMADISLRQSATLT